MHGVSKKTNINLIFISFLPSNFCQCVSSLFCWACPLEIILLHSSSIIRLPQRKFRPVTMHGTKLSKIQVWVFQLGSYLIWNWNMFAVLECGKINYHLCFKISSSRNPSHENVEVTLLTANKKGFQLEKGANRNKCIHISHLQPNKNGVWSRLSLPQKTRALCSWGQ